MALLLISLFDVTARLHPVLVHLPIGILLLACFFQLLTLSQKYAILKPAISIALFWGMLGAVASCITGFMLSQSGDYNDGLVGQHQWMGIGVAAVSIISYCINKFNFNQRVQVALSSILLPCIMLTGHLGGSLTHGEGYLTEGFEFIENKGPAIKPIANVQEAFLYTDAIQPLLKERCYTCHGPNKKKGKLRLDTPDFILKGGEDAKAVVPGNGDKSELIRRIMLPDSDEDHMPPKEKRQLTKSETDLLNWWVSSGAPFDKKIKDLPQPQEIKPVLASLQNNSTATENTPPELPDQPVDKGDENVIAKLKAAGLIINPVAKNSNYILVSFVSSSNNADTLVADLLLLKKQVLWLNLANTDITDNGLEKIGMLENLTRLHLNNTAITDKGLTALKKASALRYINLVNTSVTAVGVRELKTLKSLKSIYLYKTGVSKTDWPALQKIFPNAVLDSGGYIVPTLVTDTTKVKLPG